MIRSFILIGFCLILISSCKNDSSEKANTEVTNKYTLTPFTKSASFPDAKIEGMTYNEGTFDFTVSEGPYKLGLQTPDAPTKMCANSGKGQHIHLIVDNAPYAAKYVNKFEHDVSDGEHYLLAFLSRSYHESLKSPGASAVQKISVENKSITSSEDIKDPMLFYSRPKGTYTGKKDTKKVMLDFFPVNANIGPGKYTIKASINGEEHILDKWQPYYIEGLPMGDNTVELSLIDPSGKLASVPLNPVKRTFKLQADPTEQ
ncbi:MAG: phosphopeptide-binding protein [Bacteroidota bacterium]